MASNGNALNNEYDVLYDKGDTKTFVIDMMPAVGFALFLVQELEYRTIPNSKFKHDAHHSSQVSQTPTGEEKTVLTLLPAAKEEDTSTRSNQSLGTNDQPLFASIVKREHT